MAPKDVPVDSYRVTLLTLCLPRAAAATLLHSQSSKVLLPSLQCCGFLVGGSLKVHGEPGRPHNKATNTGRNILGNFPAAVFSRRVLDFFLHQEKG